MAEPARKLATYDDVLATAPGVIAEVIHGSLYTQSRPAKPHAAAATALGEELGPPFKRGRGGPGGWILLDEPELHLGPDILVPDLAGWRRDRMAKLDPTYAYFTMAPDWICEVLSPGTRTVDRQDKLPIYAREGVPYVWLVDPLVRTLEVLQRIGNHWVLVNSWSDDARVHAEPFDAIELDLAVLWEDVAW